MVAAMAEPAERKLAACAGRTCVAIDAAGVDPIKELVVGLIVAGVMATIATIGTWVKGVYESAQAGLVP